MNFWAVYKKILAVVIILLLLIPIVIIVKKGKNWLLNWWWEETTTQVILTTYPPYNEQIETWDCFCAGYPYKTKKNSNEVPITIEQKECGGYLNLLPGTRYNELQTNSVPLNTLNNLCKSFKYYKKGIVIERKSSFPKIDFDDKGFPKDWKKK